MNEMLFMKKRRSIKDRRSIRKANVKAPIQNWWYHFGMKYSWIIKGIVWRDECKNEQ